MKTNFQVQGSKIKASGFNFTTRISKLCRFSFCALGFFLCSCGVSIPNLEQPECISSRTVIKEFYSYHFGNDMKPERENYEQRKKYLTDDLKRRLAQQPDSAVDYFTQTDDYPKAFSVGACEVAASGKTVFDVLLFWKDDYRSEQRQIKVEMIKENNDWLVNKVENK